MSLGIVFKGPEGIVLSADSRVTLNAEKVQNNIKVVVPSTYDNATKLLKVNNQDFVGAVTYGLGALGQQQPRTAHSFLPEFDAVLAEKGVGRLSVEAFANELSGFFMRQWAAMMPKDYKEQPMHFLVGGYNENEPYGRVYELRIPTMPKPVERNSNVGEFGLTWGGQLEFVNRLMHGYDPQVIPLIENYLGKTSKKVDSVKNDMRNLGVAIPYQFLPLQDCVDLSIFLIRTTIEMQRWVVGIRGVGGAIDVATITRTEGFQYVQRKEIKGE